MAVVYIKRPSENSIVGLWHVMEPIPVLYSNLNLTEPEMEAYNTKTSDTRRLEWLALRNLLKAMITDTAIIAYDDHGVPSLENNVYNISMSHSGEYVCIYLDRKKNVGIDVQKLKKTIKAGADFFLNANELAWVDTDNNSKLHIIWSAKESIFKYARDRFLDMKMNLTTLPFDCQQNGSIEVIISKVNSQESIYLDYELFENYVLVRTT